MIPSSKLPQEMWIFPFRHTFCVKGIDFQSISTESTMSTADFELRKRLYEEIKKFNRTEQEELFRILKRENEEVSENRNGIFFDLVSLKESTLGKIKEWIQFCKKNTTEFEEREKEIELLTKENPSMIH